MAISVDSGEETVVIKATTGSENSGQAVERNSFLQTLVDRDDL